MGMKKILSYFLLGLFTGLSSFLFINMVTRVVALIIAGKLTVISREYILIFLSIILAFIWARRMLSLISVNLSQRIVWDLRKSILSLALDANYQQFSGRKTRIQTAIRNDVNSMSNASLSVVDFSISVIMTIACFIYLMYISLILFVITFAVSVFGVVVYYSTSKSNMRDLETARVLDNKFQVYFNSILHGFKEIFITPAKGKYIYTKRISVIANESYSHNIRAITALINNQMIGQVLFYVLITAVLLVFSVILKVKPDEIVSFSFTLIYLLGSIGSIMTLLPSLMQAKVASRHLLDLKDELETGAFKYSMPKDNPFKELFTEITISDLEFSYDGSEGDFSIGPIDLNIRRGEIIFIYGGNGSGKTTFINSVMGLCFPSAGQIRLNDIAITGDKYYCYRDLFSVVFSDFYLFTEIPSDDDIDMERWSFYLRLCELQGKVTIKDKIFSTTDLSTGQKKRLALVLALMEEKPILVLDEWAADQDPYFRKKFYTEIIPFLNKEGITIIAITHDDKYYHCADRLYKVSEGKLSEEKILLPEL
jgi:putative pyoverdin transport system ATP-binding/permease protein